MRLGVGLLAVFALAAFFSVWPITERSRSAMERTALSEPLQQAVTEVEALDEEELDEPEPDEYAELENAESSKDDDVSGAGPPCTIRGTVRYEDGSPATGLRVRLFAERKTLDGRGAFHYDGLVPGLHWLELEAILLEKIELLPGEEHPVDVVVPRGGRIKGTVVTADGQPVRHCVVSVHGGRWAVNERRLTSEKGTFDIGWVPGGSYDVVVRPHQPGRSVRRWFGTAPRDQKILRSLVAHCEVGAVDVCVTITLPRARPFPIRFENLPFEWRDGLPLVIWWHDAAGRLLTIPPSNAIGWVSGDSGIDLQGGRPVDPIPAPGPGAYTLTLLDPYYPQAPWLKLRVAISEGPFEEAVLRIPDGAGVIVGFNAGKPGPVRFLAIGPAIAWASEDGLVRFPRVPSGRHVIWSVPGRGLSAIVRVGEIDVPVGGVIRHTLRVEDSGSVKASPVASRPVELRREADDVLVAKQPVAHTWFYSSPIAPGRYVLVVDDRRIPVTLAANQQLDLGRLRAP